MRLNDYFILCENIHYKFASRYLLAYRYNNSLLTKQKGRKNITHKNENTEMVTYSNIMRKAFFGSNIIHIYIDKLETVAMQLIISQR
jgi:hypothetical protein